MLTWSWKITGRVLYYNNQCKNYASTYHFFTTMTVIHADDFIIFTDIKWTLLYGPFSKYLSKNGRHVFNLFSKSLHYFIIVIVYSVKGMYLELRIFSKSIYLGKSSFYSI